MSGSLIRVPDFGEERVDKRGIPPCAQEETSRQTSSHIDDSEAQSSFSAMKLLTCMADIRTIVPAKNRHGPQTAVQWFDRGVRNML